MRRLFLALFLVLAALPAHANAPAAGTRNVLYLNSYMQGYPWSDGILAGLREALAEGAGDGQVIDLQVEFLDAKRYPRPELREKLRDFLALKFRETRFDILVVSDNDAFNFAMDFGPELFAGLPVVFCGVNDFHPGLLRGRADVTGVVENFDVDGTLEAALALHRGSRRLVVVGDNSVTSRAISAQVRAAEPHFAGRLEFEHLTVDSPESLAAALANVPEDALVYLMPFYLQQGGRIMDAVEVVRFAVSRTAAPVYTSWEFMLGHGVLGGKMLSGSRHGRQAGRMALEIMAGRSPADMPVVQQSDDHLMFDAKVLERFGIDPVLLPPGSRVINREPFIELEKPVFWIIMASLVVLSGILVLLVVNIAKRRAMERQVTDQLHFLQLVIDTIPIPLYFRDRDGAFGLFNARFEEWFCLNARGTCQQQCFSARCAGLSSLADAVDEELLARPGVRIYERTVQDVDGSRHDVLVHKATHRDARGEVQGLVGVLYDITDRKQAEENLRESRAMLRTVLDTIPQLVYWKDRHNRYLGANRSFASFFGLQDPAAVVGRTNDQIMDDPVEAKRGEGLEREVMATGQARFGVSWEIERGGGAVTLEINKVPLQDGAGRVVGVLSTAEDVTAKRSLERQLLQSQKMEAIGTFVSGIAHDFNNILTTIINSAELALLDMPETAEGAVDIRRALAAARRGSQLVRQIHTYCRPGRKQPAAVDLAPVAREALDLVRASLPGNIRLAECQETGGHFALADPTQIHQVLMNLCTNAFQALRDAGGTMEVGLADVCLPEEPARLLGIEPGQYVRLWVADDGPGVPPRIIDKIFDPFFTTKGTGEGTGLGLAVVQGIVKGHKGAVAVASQPGVRTTFEVYLPAAGALPDPAPAEDQGAAGGDERVLFVEDDQDQLQTVPRSLERLGYRVVACHGAAEALDLLAEADRDFDLVVTDFDMPDMHGLSFSNRLAQLRPALPVIMVTGRPGATEAATQAGNIRRVLLKPYSGQELSGAIRTVLEG